MRTPGQREAMSTRSLPSVIASPISRSVSHDQRPAALVESISTSGRSPAWAESSMIVLTNF
jgi:hypothetical protein